MAMRLQKDSEILDPGVRKIIIGDIEGTENKRRKDEAYRRFQVYKDKTSSFVTELLLEQFSQETVREMSYSITNISIVRKIINKLSRVYIEGAKRTVPEDDESTAKIEELEKLYNLDQRMKTQNRITKLQRNSICYVKPCPFFDREGNKMMRVRISPMNPYLYDVVEESFDRTRPLVYVMSNYEPGALLHTSLDPARVRTQSGHLRGGFSTHVSPSSANVGLQGDGTDQSIADKKEDENAGPEDEKIYIWWTDNYHFTTRGSQMIDEDGKPFEPAGPDDERILNPIEEMPIVNFSIDQDNSFWAIGGEDLVDAGIVVNSMLTQVNHIGVVQGYGQFFMTGKDLPRNQTVGPSKAIILEVADKDDPQPTIGFATANPPLRDLMQNVESLVALTLTTNDLSTSGVSANLDGGAMAPSAVAIIVDKAESQEDVRDQRQMFIDAEPQIMRKANKWNQIFAEDNNLDEDFDDLLLPDDFEMATEFNEPQTIVTESDKLSNLKKRKELGINTMLEIIQLDQPGLDDKAAQAKLDKIAEEKEQRMKDFVGTVTDEEVIDGNPSEEDDSRQNPDDEQNRSV